jgi:serine/threonine protein phosphatase PrpC
LIGLHPTNVRYEPAVYAVTPRSVSKDSTCIAMTRALGDFYAHQFGLCATPSINIRTINHNENTNENNNYTILLASDGIWDCWKYEEFHTYCNEQLLKQNDINNISMMGEITLDESICRAITNFGNKHYDDACLVVWKIKL